MHPSSSELFVDSVPALHVSYRMHNSESKRVHMGVQITSNGVNTSSAWNTFCIAIEYISLRAMNDGTQP